MANFSELGKMFSTIGSDLAKSGLKQLNKNGDKIIKTVVDSKALQKGVAKGSEIIKTAAKSQAVKSGVKTVVDVVLSEAAQSAVESGLSLFNKPYYICFESLEQDNVDDFKKQMSELGLPIQMYKTQNHDFSGKILSYFHSVKKAEMFTYKLPVGLAQYYVVDINVK